MSATEGFSFVRRARTRANGLILAAVAALLIALRLLLGVTFLILVPLALLTLPAVLDFVRDRRAGLTIDRRGISWFVGSRGESIPRAQIDHVVTGRSLDLGLKAIVVLRSGKRRRLPPPCLPDRDTLEAALAAHGIPLARNAPPGGRR